MRQPPVTPGLTRWRRITQTLDLNTASIPDELSITCESNRIPHTPWPSSVLITTLCSRTPSHGEVHEGSSSRAAAGPRSSCAQSLASNRDGNEALTSKAKCQPVATTGAPQHVQVEETTRVLPLGSSEPGAAAAMGRAGVQMFPGRGQGSPSHLLLQSP